MTPGGYIVHHLTHFQNYKPAGIADFGVINFDSVFWSVLLGFIGLGILWLAARKATSGVPGRFQGAVEMIIEMVDTQARGIVHNEMSRRVVAPVALTVFVWIFFMNLMDMLPVDLIPRIWQALFGAAGHDPEHAYMRVVPTADLSITLGMALGVFLIVLYYNIKIKGLFGFIGSLFTSPFHADGVVAKICLAPANFLLNIIEFVAKTVSHGMRLFGNMYAGELLFMLIALLGASATASLGGAALFAGQILAGSFWTIFHILIIVLQAFIFMMLTLVYIGQAHEHH